MKTLSELGQEIAPNRVKTWLTYVGLDYVNPPTGPPGFLGEGGWRLKFAGVPLYYSNPLNRRVTLPAGRIESDAYQVFPWLQAYAFPSLSMTHVPDPGSADGTRASVTAVLANPVAQTPTTTVYDWLSGLDDYSGDFSNGYWPSQKVLAVGNWFSLWTRCYLPEQLTREEQRGIPWLPMSARDWNMNPGGSEGSWDWRFEESRDPYFVGRIASVEAVGETTTITATNQEEGFEWPRIPNTGTHEPSRGERIPLIYGNAKNVPVPILFSPWKGSLVSDISRTGRRGIRLSKPLDGLPPEGSIWIGGERVTYDGIDLDSGVLENVTRGQPSGVFKGSRTFHSAGETCFGDGSTTIVVSDDSVTSISALYIRANASETPVVVPSSLYQVRFRTEAERPELGSATTEIGITSTQFQHIVTAYQRATLAEQAVEVAADDSAAPLAVKVLGTDQPDVGDEPPFTVLASSYRDGSSGFNWPPYSSGQQQDRIIRRGLFPLWEYRNDIKGKELSGRSYVWGYGITDGETVGMDTAAVTLRCPKEVGDNYYLAGMFWQYGCGNGANNSAFADFGAWYMGKADFSLDVRVTRIGAGTSQEFILGLAGSTRETYNFAYGEVLASFVAEEAGTYSVSFTLEFSTGTRLSHILTGSEHRPGSGGLKFVLFPGQSTGTAGDFEVSINDASGNLNDVGMTVYLRESLDDLPELTDQVVVTAVEKSRSDYFSKTSPYRSVSANTLELVGSDVEVAGYETTYNENRTALTPNTFSDPYKLWLKYVPDMAGFADAKTAEAFDITLNFYGSDATDDLYQFKWGLDNKSVFAIAIENSFLQERDGADQDGDDSFEYAVTSSRVNLSDNYRNVWLNSLDPELFQIDLSVTGTFTSTAIVVDAEGAALHASQTEAEGSPTANCQIVWTFYETTEETGGSLGESQATVGEASIAANPGDFELEFMVDASGPSAVLGQAITPSDDYSLEWNDFQALDETNYGPGTVVETPTDIIKRWIQRSPSVSKNHYGTVSGGDDPFELFDADYRVGWWELSTNNLNEHYKILGYDAAARYTWGFDARDLGSDWESVLSRLAFEARTNLTRTSGSENNPGMPYRMLAAGEGPGYAWPAAAKQIDVSEILAFDYIGKRNEDFANDLTVFYETDNSRTSNEDDSGRYRKVTVSRPGGITGGEIDWATVDVTSETGCDTFRHDEYLRVTQTGATVSLQADLPTGVPGNLYRYITVSISRQSAADSTFTGALSFRSNTYSTWGTAPSIDFTDYGTGDPTDGVASSRIFKYTYDLTTPPDPEPAAWTTFIAAWTSGSDQILGIDLGLDSTLGDDPSVWKLYSVRVHNDPNATIQDSIELIGNRPRTFTLEAHRTPRGEFESQGALDWRKYMERELARDDQLVRVIVATDAGWDLELGDVVTCDVPAEILDEHTVPVAGTVNLRVIGWDRNPDGVALVGVIV